MEEMTTNQPVTEEPKKSGKKSRHHCGGNCSDRHYRGGGILYGA